MPRLAVFLAALGTVAYPAAAAPIPDGAPKLVFYHATEPGTRWVYSTSCYDWRQGAWKTMFERTEVVTAVTWKGPEALVSVAGEQNGQRYPLRTLLVKSDGLYNAGRSDGQKIDPPSCILKLRAPLGLTWNSKFDELPRSTTRGVEEVDVPAGKYRALRVDFVQRVSNLDTKQSQWFAEGVGLVKTVHEGQMVDVLKSFTPGKR
jgi:hypothetical protein